MPIVLLILAVMEDVGLWILLPMVLLPMGDDVHAEDGDGINNSNGKAAATKRRPPVLRNRDSLLRDVIMVDDVSILMCTSI